MVEEYKDRLAQAMKDADVSTAQLAFALEISYQAVRKVLLGGQFGMDNNAAAAKFLGVRSDWLATGKGAKKPSAQDLPEWPFSDQLRAKVVHLRPPEVRSLEVAMWVHLREDIPSHLLSDRPNEAETISLRDEQIAREVIAKTRRGDDFTKHKRKAAK